MTNEQASVKRFHEVFQLLAHETPTPVDLRTHELRVNLAFEELTEFRDARDLVEVADALGDSLYIILGSAVTYGIDLEPVFQEIHRSNMSKMWTDEEVLSIPDGCKVVHSLAIGLERRHVVKRMDGKVIKSPSYSPAGIAKVLEAQERMDS